MKEKGMEEKRKIKKSRRKKRNLGEEELRKKVDLQSTKTTIFYQLEKVSCI